MYIVATISKNSYPAEKIEEIIRAGANVLRFNFAHGTPEEMEKKVSVAQGVIKKLRKTGKVAILADLPGAKIRLGKLATGDEAVEKGQKLIFKTAKESQTAKDFVPVDFPGIARFVKKDQIITLADGQIALRVTASDQKERFEAVALNNWFIPPLKGINVGRAIDELDHITDITKNHIAALASIAPDWVAFSFVNDGAYLDRARTLMAPYLTKTWKPKIVSKIESPRAMKNLDAIIKKSDIIMVARGDFGLTEKIELLGVNQKAIIKRVKKFKKEVVVATQILDSILQYYIPSRSDVLDLTNIVLDGADGIVLAKETGLSLTPGYSVEMAQRIIHAVQHETT